MLCMHTDRQQQPVLTSTNEDSLWVWVHHHGWVHQQLMIHPLIHLRALDFAIQKQRLQHSKANNSSVIVGFGAAFGVRWHD